MKLKIIRIIKVYHEEQTLPIKAIIFINLQNFNKYIKFFYESLLSNSLRTYKLLGFFVQRLNCDCDLNINFYRTLKKL